MTARDTTVESVAGGPVGRVAVTEAAAELLRELWGQHGPVIFHQSGGCCDGSSPMCYPDGDLLLGDADVHLGDLDVSASADQPGTADDGATSAEPAEGRQVGDGPQTAAGRRVVPFYMSRFQYDYWSHTHLTVDVVPGRGAGFSLEAPTGQRFVIRSRLFTDTEAEAMLAAQG